MTSPPNTPDASSGADPSLRRVLGLPSLVLFGLTYMSPVAVFTTYGLVQQQTNGHLPAAYVVATVAMLLTAHSYGRMVAAFPAAGSAYRYARGVFGPHLGFLSGWTLMLDYLFLPMVSFLLAGIYLNSQFPGVPGWIFSLALLLVVLVLNVLGVKVLSGVSAIVMAVTAVVIGIFVVLAFGHSAAPAGDVLTSFLPGSSDISVILGGAAILAFSFLGFDGVSTMAEETRDPRRTVPRGILLATLVGGLLFILVAWSGSLAHPSTDFENADAAGVELMVGLGGKVFSSIFVAVYVLGCFGSALVSQASVARILYAMGRDRLLPAPLGRVDARWQTPVVALVLVSAVGLLSCVLTLEQAVVMINFGALVAFSVVNLAVIKHYIVDKGERTARSVLVNAVVPGLGFVATAWLWTGLTGETFVVGFVWVAVGLIYLVATTRFFTRPPAEVDFSE
ncbi:amino acid permease [Kineosporia succinea]